MEDSRLKRIRMIGYPDYYCHQIKIITRAADWEIYEADNQGEVEIVCDIDGDLNNIFLSQDELKEVIAFLQKQVKQ